MDLGFGGNGGCDGGAGAGAAAFVVGTGEKYMLPSPSSERRLSDCWRRRSSSVRLINYYFYFLL